MTKSWVAAIGFIRFIRFLSSSSIQLFNTKLMQRIRVYQSIYAQSVINEWGSPLGDDFKTVPIYFALNSVSRAPT